MESLTGKRYLKRKQHYHALFERLAKSFSLMIKLKLLVLLSFLGAVILCLILKRYAAAGGAFFLGIVLLISLDIRHNKIQQRQKFTGLLEDLNEHALWRLDQRWSAFNDTGAEFKDDNHPYSSDLDIFGKGSLFQLINAGHTFLGRKKLAALLKSPPESAVRILERQKAIAELAKYLKWRQCLAAYGIMTAGKANDPEELILWANDEESFFSIKTVILSIRAISTFTVTTTVLYFLTHQIPFYLPLGALLLQYILLKISAKHRRKILNSVLYYHKNLELYQQLLEHIEKKQFATDYLRKLTAGLQNRQRETAGAQLARLVRISDKIATRAHAFYGIFNTLTLWDYHCLIALESWKEESGRNLAKWLETIGEIEALASLAILKYDHPDWATPQIVGTPLVYTAKSVGHPLLPAATRKGNDLQIGDQARALLITGSNMSGKSTYLRTAGINLVLAYAGAPVCATVFHCSRMNIYTCMRVSDNLEKNISTFYAELLRIKMIVKATEDKEPAFFLLDEVFKGTNSVDRHTGAKVLIKKLIGRGAVGLVSTHDLELGELEAECRTVKNYHFQEFFRDGELSFDYRLHPGVSTTRNALYLMRAAGIDINE